MFFWRRRLPTEVSDSDIGKDFIDLNKVSMNVLFGAGGNVISQPGWCVSGSIRVKPGDTFVYSCSTSYPAQVIVGWYYSGNPYFGDVGQPFTGNTEQTIVIPEGMHFMRVNIGIYDNIMNGIDYCSLIKVQPNADPDLWKDFIVYDEVDRGKYLGSAGQSVSWDPGAVTDFISVNAGDTFEYFYWGLAGQWQGICMYSGPSESQFVANPFGATISGAGRKIFTIPEGVTHIRADAGNLNELVNNGNIDLANKDLTTLIKTDPNCWSNNPIGENLINLQKCFHGLSFTYETADATDHGPSAISHYVRVNPGETYKITRTLGINWTYSRGYYDKDHTWMANESRNPPLTEEFTVPDGVYALRLMLGSYEAIDNGTQIVTMERVD